MTETLPINGAVLTWARKSIGLEIDTLAEKMKVPGDMIRKWESGDAGPTYPQLEKLASQYLRRPIAVFFFPSVPEEDGIKTDFRSVPGTLLDALPHGVISLYRKAKSLQYSLEELVFEEWRNDESILNSVDVGGDVISLAETTRQQLGVSIEEQLHWKSVGLALKRWREVLESKGIFVFKGAFKDDRFSGFCLSHSRYPLIYVNNSKPYSRQIFTLFHELYHLLARTGGVDFSDDDLRGALTAKHGRIEQQANKFANAVLVPPAIFQREDHSVTDDNIQRLASRYSVSREVVLRNFLDRGIVPPQVYADFVMAWSEQNGGSKDAGRGNYYNNQIAYYGKRYLDIVFGNYYAGRLTMEQVSQHLHMKVKSAEALEQRVVNLA